MCSDVYSYFIHGEFTKTKPPRVGKTFNEMKTKTFLKKCIEHRKKQLVHDNRTITFKFVCLRLYTVVPVQKIISVTMC